MYFQLLIESYEGTKLADSFTMGVIVSTQQPISFKNDPSKCFAKFTISNLKKYDDLLTQMIKGKDVWKEQFEAFKKFKLTSSGYKEVTFIVFGELAHKLKVRNILLTNRKLKLVM